MTSALDTYAEEVLTRARGRVAEAEVYAVELDETPVQFEANRLKMLQTRHTRAIALRVIKDGRIGFATSSRPDDAAALVDLAVELSAFGAEARFAMPAPEPTPAVLTFDEATPAVPMAAMVELGQMLIAGVLDVAPDVLCDASVQRTVQQIRILNSAGLDRIERTSVFAVGVGGQWVRGTDMLWVGDDSAACSPILDGTSLITAVRLQLERARENVPVRTATMPVIFTPPGVASALLEPLITAFSGRIVLQGASPLVESLGQQLYDPLLSVTDDPLAALRPTSRAFDDEGVPSRRVPLIERGVVREFLYDLQTAGLAGRASTASAHRSLTSPPAISSTAVVIGLGETSLQAMIDGLSEGVIVEQLIGGGQGNTLGGDFSGNVVLGYKIERGAIVGRVKNTMVAGNVHQAFKKIGALGSDGRWVDGLFTGPIMLESISVASAD